DLLVRRTPGPTESATRSVRRVSGLLETAISDRTGPECSSQTSLWNEVSKPHLTSTATFGIISVSGLKCRLIRSLDRLGNHPIRNCRSITSKMTECGKSRSAYPLTRRKGSKNPGEPNYGSGASAPAFPPRFSKNSDCDVHP